MQDAAITETGHDVCLYVNQFDERETRGLVFCEMRNKHVRVYWQILVSVIKCNNWQRVRLLYIQGCKDARNSLS